jgi:hypothetical protein
MVSPDFPQLRQEVRFVPNCCEAFIRTEIRVNLSPLSSMPHVCEVELMISQVLHAGETSFKARGNGIGMGAGISGAEVEVALIPSGEDVRQIVESCILWRRFKVLELQVLLDQFLGFRGQLGLNRIRHLHLRRFGRAIHPCFAKLCHSRLPV